MSHEKKPVSLVPLQKSGSALRDLLGPPPLLEGEDLAAYEALHDRVLTAVEPADAIEEIWVRDVVDILWELLRYRGMKSDLMAAEARRSLDDLLDKLNADGKFELVRGWAARDRRAIKEVKSVLAEAGLDERAIHAQTLARKLDTFERIDRSIMQMEARRNVALRELDRRRAALARRLRDVVVEIEDAEFTEAEPGRDAAE